MNIDMPSVGTPNGIYVFQESSKKWTLLRSEGEPFSIGELGEGVYFVYFDNTLCPACRAQDQHLLKVLLKYGSNSEIKFVIILCDWFASTCTSQAAAETFRKYEVKASPTILIAKVKSNGMVIERLEGVRKDSVLEYYLKKALGEHVEEELKNQS
ncbi:MAG: thioredoxin family protein [Acidilobaceae archaeon]